MTGTSKTILHEYLADKIDPRHVISRSRAELVFKYFQQSRLFRWNDANNDCEDRANAMCILLDAWNIPNYKHWIVSGYFIKKGFGGLINGWNYHVATALPVQEGEGLVCYIVDPATSQTLTTVDDWAGKLTNTAFSYHFMKSSDYYIFPAGNIEKNNWHKRDKQNFRWTMQGLSGINGVSMTGKAQLIFNKKKIRITEQLFRQLKGCNPFAMTDH